MNEDDLILEKRREQELLLRAAYINGAEWACDYHSETLPSLNVIEEAFYKYLNDAP